MTHVRLKLAIGGIILVGAVAYLGSAGIRSGWVYYVEVDPFLANAEYHDQRVRLCGKADEQQFAASPAQLTADFALNGETGSVTVAYAGVVPNSFTPGCEVVVEGRLGDDGVFHADKMLTKCASKYQAEDHAKRLAHPEGDPE